MASHSVSRRQRPENERGKVWLGVKKGSIHCVKEGMEASGRGWPR